TPLVDLATVPWACWPGYFGEASPLEVTAAGTEESLRDALRKVVFVAGPRAPLLQAENEGVCKADPQASEQSILPRLQAARASSAGH
ncbi:MAG TPA: hypothetical protein VNR42_10555, partial [Solirubrobacteraceae bacterium]|nr:hypothetical protein [Solirubrobacteraceae bacterium]